MYNVNWYKLGAICIPAALRKPIFLAWLEVLYAPILYIDTIFFAFRKRTDFRIRTTGQVRILRHALNITFDPVENRIQILNGGGDPAIFMYTKSENKPLYLPIFLTKGGNDYDFIVSVPGALYLSKRAIIDFVNTYKLTSKRFLFVYSSKPPRNVSIAAPAVAIPLPDGP